MGHDAMANHTPSAAAAAAREIGKKKRANRAAKLKQCKLDARREQWLSQKARDKDVSTATSPASPPERVAKGRSTDMEQQSSKGFGLGLQESSDVESVTHHLGGSPPRKDRHSNNITGSSGSSIGSCSRSISDAEEETGEKGGGDVDDWEAIADALSVAAESDQCHHPITVVDSGTHAMGTPEPTKRRETDRSIPRAWKPDDEFRPQSLPNLSKQLSFSGSIGRQYGLHRYDHRGILSTPPSSCPICCEDLDITDSSFQPCSCGFHLCLFCHKRILEADGRCPGCRKQYSTMTSSSEEIRASVGLLVPPLPFSRSRSMGSRY